MPRSSDTHPSVQYLTIEQARSGAAERHFSAALLGLALAALGLRLVRLGAQSLWIDEVLSYGWIAEIHKHGFASLLHDIHGPLQALAIWATSHVSTSEWWLRFPSALAGAAAVPLLGLLGRALWGAQVGLAAAGLLAISPFALYYSQECRDYSLCILFAIVLSLAALAFVARPGARRAAGLGAGMLAAVLSNLNGLFFILGLGSWGIVVLRARRPALAGWIATHLVVGLLLVPYAWEITHQVRPERLVGVETGFGEKEPLRGQTTLHWMAVPYTAYAFSVGYSLGPTLEDLRADPVAAARPRHWPAFGLALLGFGVPFLFGLLQRGALRGRGLLVVPALATLGFTVWLAATNMKPYNVRYLSVLLPGFLLFVALGLCRSPRRAGALLGALAVVASLWSCFNYLFLPRYGRDDVRGAVSWVADRAAPDDVVLQISLTGPMRYYYDRLGTRPVHPPAGALASPEAAREYLAGLVRGARAVWYLECRPQGMDPRGLLRKTLQSMAKETTTTPFVGLRVHRFELAAPSGASVPAPGVPGSPSVGPANSQAAPGATPAKAR